MVKYYIKITDEEPSSDDNALWFELEANNDEKGEFFVLRRNEYTELVNQFDIIQNNLKGEYVQPLVDEVIGQFLSDNDSKLTSIESELSSKVNISDVDDSLSSVSTNPVQNKTVTTALENKADNTTITSLQSSIDGKASSSHSHSNWVHISFNSYCNGYYNPDLRLITMRYVKENHNFSNTNVIKLHGGLFKNFKPIIGGDVILNMANVNQKGSIDDATGDMYVQSLKTGTANISTSAIWRY